MNDSEWYNMICFILSNASNKCLSSIKKIVCEMGKNLCVCICVSVWLSVLVVYVSALYDTHDSFWYKECMLWS